MIREHIKKIELEDSFISKDRQTLTLFFTAPVKILGKKCPGAISAELMIEVECKDVKLIDVEASPTKRTNNGTSDSDWRSIDVSEEEMVLLLSKIPASLLP